MRDELSVLAPISERGLGWLCAITDDPHEPESWRGVAWVDHGPPSWVEVGLLNGDSIPVPNQDRDKPCWRVGKLWDLALAEAGAESWVVSVNWTRGLDPDLEAALIRARGHADTEPLAVYGEFGDRQTARAFRDAVVRDLRGLRHPPPGLRGEVQHGVYTAGAPDQRLPRSLRPTPPPAGRAIGWRADPASQIGLTGTLRSIAERSSPASLIERDTVGWGPEPGLPPRYNGRLR